MAEPTTLQLNQQMFTLASYYGVESEPFWLGLRFDTAIKNFFWISNNLKMTFPIWGNGQPDLLNGICVILDLSASLWSTQDCNQPQRVICQTGKDTYDINLFAKKLLRGTQLLFIAFNHLNRF